MSLCVLVLITVTPISLKFILIAFRVELMNYLIYFGSYIILYYDKKKRGGNVYSYFCVDYSYLTFSLLIV